jgi:hypothetical protein
MLERDKHEMLEEAAIYMEMEDKRDYARGDGYYTIESIERYIDMLDNLVFIYGDDEPSANVSQMSSTQRTGSSRSPLRTSMNGSRSCAGLPKTAIPSPFRQATSDHQTAAPSVSRDFGWLHPPVVNTNRRDTEVGSMWSRESTPRSSLIARTTLLLAA